jgi:hypothetical protein
MAKTFIIGILVFGLNVLMFARELYAVTFVAQTQVIVPGAQHQLETPDIIVTCYTADTPPQVVEADSITIDPNSFDVTINFAVAQSGKCVLR